MSLKTSVCVYKKHVCAPVVLKMIAPFGFRNIDLQALLFWLLQIQALSSQGGHADDHLRVRSSQVVDVRI